MPGNIGIDASAAYPKVLVAISAKKGILQQNHFWRWDHDHREFSRGQAKNNCEDKTNISIAKGKKLRDAGVPPGLRNNHLKV